MAIAFDAVTGNAYDANTSGSFSHTCTGTNRGLLAFSYSGGATNGATVTYGGVAMTYVGIIDQGNGERVSVFKLANPASGSNTFAWSSWPGGGTRWTLVSYTGVNQTDIVHNSNLVAQTADPITPSVTSSTADCWAVVGIVSAANFSSFTTGTLRQNASGNKTVVGDSNGTFSTSYAFNIDMSGSSQSGSAVIALAPASTGYTLTCAQGSYTLTGQDLTFKRALKLAMAYGSYVLTGQATALKKASKIVLDYGSYVLSGIAMVFRTATTGITNETKNTSIITNTSKNSASITNVTKNASTITNQTKS